MKQEFEVGDLVKLQIDPKGDRPTYVFGKVVLVKSHYGTFSYGFAPDAGEGWFWSQKIVKR